MHLRWLCPSSKGVSKSKHHSTENKGKDDPSSYNFPELEYFVYTPGNTKSGSIASSFTGGFEDQDDRDSITYCTSGLVDRNKGSTLSWLHKAIKPLNQLMMIGMSVIYRLSRHQNVESSISTLVIFLKSRQGNTFVMS